MDGLLRSILSSYPLNFIVQCDIQTEPNNFIVNLNISVAPYNVSEGHFTGPSMSVEFSYRGMQRA